jgi:hypothetical protein
LYKICQVCHCGLLNKPYGLKYRKLQQRQKNSDDPVAIRFSAERQQKGRCCVLILDNSLTHQVQLPLQPNGKQYHCKLFYTFPCVFVYENYVPNQELPI